MTPFCSDPFDALQAFGEILGLPISGREPHTPEVNPTVRGNTDTPRQADSSGLRVSDDATGDQPSRPYLYLAADNEEQT